jgi:hypothetical protein
MQPYSRRVRQPCRPNPASPSRPDPYDDPTEVMRTLDRAVGPRGYHFTVEASALDAAPLSEMDLTVSDPAVDVRPEWVRSRAAVHP